jgi:hypothetical protein
MTVNASNTRELTIDQLLKRAMQLAGIMALEQPATGSQWNARAEFGRDQLDLILDKMPNQGVIVRQEEGYTLTLPVSSDYGGEDDPIDLPSDTVDVVGPAMYKETSTSTEQMVTPVDWETWQTSQDKTRTAAPARYYLKRAGTVQLFLLPVPATSGAELRIRRVKLLADSDVGSNTVDLERHWLDYLQFELAWRFAVQGSMPADRKNDLRTEAINAKNSALALAKQQLPSFMELDHVSRWT